MYCKNCGKFIGTDAEVCDECRQKQEALNENETVYQPVVPPLDTSAIKLGKAIASIILATFGFVFAYVGIFVATMETVASGMIVAAGVCLAIAIVPTILGLAFGIQAIKSFKNTSHIKSGKRIPLLILGISSTIYAGSTLFICFVLAMFVVAL